MYQIKLYFFKIFYLQLFEIAATPGSMAVLLERTYHSITNPDEEIPSSERIKGYKYGKNWVTTKINP